LVDFRSMRWAQVEASGLTELHRAAVSERAERLLTLGRFDELVADLEPMVRADPLQERFAGLLMTALFNAGRQSDAIAVFGRARQALRDELGVDPSRELRATMQQILQQQEPVPRTAPADRLPRRDGARSELPLRVTSFVGRDDLMAAVARRLDGSRLVTLVGPGGAGKTALAVEVARVAAQARRDGAALVRLASVVEADGVCHAIADALGFSLAGGTVALRPLDALTGQLAGRDALVVLDNCEHVLDAVAEAAEAILTRCPDVHLVATSREALAVLGETQIPVPPLEVPAAEATPQEAAGVASVRVFLDRAEALRPEPLDDPDSLAAVADICRTLDGIPLALELAAARLTSLTPAELAAGLDDRFGILTGGSRTAEVRQRTLRDAVEWSHTLMTDEERRMFRRLAVFVGGWSLPAARAVVGEDGDDAQVGSTLDRLVRQSLVLAEPTGGRTRYRMLETLRQFARHKLAESGEQDSILARHAGYFAHLAHGAETGLRGPEQAAWLATLRTEHGNLRAALSWSARDDGDPVAAQELAGSLGLYWHMGRHLEGREALRTVLALPGGTAHSRARALQALSLVERPRACIVHPNEQCAAAARESLLVFDAVGDGARAAFSRVLLAVEAVGSPLSRESEELLEEAAAEFSRRGDPWGQAVVSFVRMETVAKHGDEASTRLVAAEATMRFRELRDGWGLSAVLYHFGWALGRFGRWHESADVLAEAIQVATDAGIYNTVQWASADRGVALLALGRIEEASGSFARAGAVSHRVGDSAAQPLTEYGAAVIAQREHRYADARTLFGRALEGFQVLGVRVATGLALVGLGACDEALGRPASARGHYRELLRVADSDGDVGLVATALEGLARLSDEDPGLAAAMLGHAEALRTAHDRPLPPDERDRVSATVRSLRSALGSPAFDAAAARGAGKRPDVS
jgi:predicted ATPase